MLSTQLSSLRAPAYRRMITNAARLLLQRRSSSWIARGALLDRAWYAPAVMPLSPALSPDFEAAPTVSS